GQPIYATSKTDADRLFNETGSPFLFDSWHPGFGDAIIQVGAPPTERSGDLTRLFAGDLAGHRGGELVKTPTQSRPFGDWSLGTVSMPRLVGPFPLAPSVPREAFERQYPNRSVGDVVH